MMKLERSKTGGVEPHAIEPCRLCGEETAVGTVFYSDRRELTSADGRRSYVCRLCIERTSRGRRPSDAELQRAINEAAVIGQVWGSQTH